MRFQRRSTFFLMNVDGDEKMADLFLKRSAKFSACRTWRYSLVRTWDETKPLLPFVMLNPSRADEWIDDPTNVRCVSFAKREGAGGTYVGNVFAFRATDPCDMRKAEDPFGPDNDEALREIGIYAADRGVPVVCAWGVHAKHRGGECRSLGVLRDTGAKLVCLGKTLNGHPRHPLYLISEQPMEAY